MSFDTIAVVDWSGGNDRGPTPKKDAIWIAVQRGEVAQDPVYCRNRQVAESVLRDLIRDELAAGRRLCIGFDFTFGYPAGFAAALTGEASALAVWQWIAERIVDTARGNNRFDVAATINTQLQPLCQNGGTGPFWGNALGRDIDGLTRNHTGYDLAFPARRACDLLAKGSLTCWQLAGAGSVGSQSLMGLPVLQRLRQAFADQIAIWPFEPRAVSEAPVAFVEVWPSMIAQTIAATTTAPGSDNGIPDRAQVRVLAAALARMSQTGELERMMTDVPDGAPRREEGWILGIGHEAALAAAAEAGAAPAPPPLKNDCFALPLGVDWTPVDDALAHLRGNLSPVTGAQKCSVGAALGRVLAEDVVAVRANPPGANSAVDGYGFAYDALPDSSSDAPHVLPLVEGRAAAGAPFSATVPAGQAIRILTGALLPAGVDTVVLQEDCSVAAGQVAFQTGVKSGANARAAGEDVSEGAPVLNAGRVLTPADLALLSAVGVAEVSVRGPLRVGVLSTGDELAAPGSTLDPGRTYDANRPMLLGLLERWGYVPVDLGHVADDRAALAARLDGAAVDAILTSGGASAGEEDHVSALLGEAGARTIWRVAMKPGRPLALGLWNGVPVFGLPGNPVAAFTCSLVFARPALAVLAGADWAAPVGFTVPAAFAKRKKPGRREYLRARIGTDGRAEVFRSEGSGRVSGLSWAEGFVELPDGAVTISPDDPVRYIPFGSFGL